MDIASVSALLGSLKTATDIAKFIRTSDLSIEKAETKLKLAELVSALADAKLEAAEVQHELLARDERIRGLETAAKVHESLIWHEPCYWMNSSGGAQEPYCQSCYDGKLQLSRLHSDNEGQFECRVCDKTFKSQDRKLRDSARLRSHMSGSTDGFPG